MTSVSSLVEACAPRIDAERRVSILAVDSHDLVHWALKALLTRNRWVDGYFAALTEEDALRLAQRHRADVALIDATVGETGAADLCARLREVVPEISLILMSEAGRVSAASAKASGASGFVSKAWRGEDVVDAVRMITLGLTVFAPELNAHAATLSDRELQVLRLVAAGATNREIASTLYLSPHTVKDHTTAVYRKINARNRAEASVRAQRLGLLV
jgi:DNA-binding NarL/FixJ family response regulator